MEDENCRSLSGFTDSTEQSAPVNFDMSNRVCVNSFSLYSLPKSILEIRFLALGKTSARDKKHSTAFGEC